VRSLAATGDAFVAAGAAGSGSAASPPEAGQAVLWTSRDGRSFDPVTSLPNEPTEAESYTAVAADGDRVIAVGFSEGPAGRSLLISVSVDDGASWTTTRSTPLAPGREPTGVAIQGDTAVVVANAAAGATPPAWQVPVRPT